MEDLRVIGVEDGALVVTSDRGDRYRIEIDDTLTSKIRQAGRDRGVSRRLAPKDIQAHIRSGMSAQDVASITGADLEYIERFEGPILAEREFVIQSAMAVPVHTARDTEFGDIHATFGSAILARLQELSAVGERWASWKEEGSGWVVKLSFTADQIDHDARWRFDPKRSSLAPLNHEAEALSRQGELTGKLIPRLRAVDGGDRMTDSSRFDSGAFVDLELAEVRTPPSLGMTSEAAEKPVEHNETSLRDTAPHLEAIPFGRSSDRADSGPVPGHTPTNQTADLLEALRRRRGERESASFDDRDDVMSGHPSTGSIRLVSVPLGAADDDDDDDRQTAPQPVAAKPAYVQQQSQKSTKRGRASVPSWDEIVFGARSDDDPA
ncbi:MAG: septation protein SepH [Terrimesophilobacter sp.]